MMVALLDTLRMATTMHKSPYNNNIQSFSMSISRSESTGNHNMWIVRSQHSAKPVSFCILCPRVLNKVYHELSSYKPGIVLSVIQL